jgi:hypothetical protein
MHPEEFLCRTWTCQRCGFRSPWWNGCGRFLYCTTCERIERNHQLANVAESAIPEHTHHASRPANLSVAIYSYRPQRR